MTRSDLIATRDAAEAALETTSNVEERIALMNTARRAQKQLDTIAQEQRMAAPPFTANDPLTDALARFFSPYEHNL